MISLLRIAPSPHHFIRLNKDFMVDLRSCGGRHSYKGMEWHVFPPGEEHHIEFASDASGSWGSDAGLHSVGPAVARTIYALWCDNHASSSPSNHAGIATGVMPLLRSVSVPFWRRRFNSSCQPVVDNTLADLLYRNKGPQGQPGLLTDSTPVAGRCCSTRTWTD